MDSINIITGSYKTSAVVIEQIKSSLKMPLQIHVMTLDEGGEMPPKENITIYTSQIAYEEFTELHGELFPKKIIAGRKMDFKNLSEIILIPKEGELLVVNDTEEGCVEVIENLKKLGFSDFKYKTYYPNSKEDVSRLKIAVTTGEPHLAPKGIKEIIDLGPRNLDFKTIHSLIKLLGGTDEDINGIVEYNNGVFVELASRIARMNEENKRLSSVLHEKIINKGYTARYDMNSIVGESAEINRVKEIVRKLSKTDLSILIEGESGTGKEILANVIHNESNRSKYPFLAVNFSALSDSLMESELFGYEEGAFTGALKGGKAGLFEQANGGSIFLDEIGDISPKMQTRLLRVIQEKEIMRVGGNKIIPIDVRIIAATHKNLKEMIEEELFRADLYYRLKVGKIAIPPLRDRREDIEQHIAKEIKSMGNLRGISADAVEMLKSYPWAGNARELKNALEFMAALSEGDEITVGDLKLLEIEELCTESVDIEIESRENSKLSKDKLSQEMIRLIETIDKIEEEGEVASKQKIIEAYEQRGEKITDYRLRKLIKKGKESGIFEKNEGSYGIRLCK